MIAAVKAEHPAKSHATTHGAAAERPPPRTSHFVSLSRHHMTHMRPQMAARTSTQPRSRAHSHTLESRPEIGADSAPPPGPANACETHVPPQRAGARTGARTVTARFPRRGDLPPAPILYTTGCVGAAEKSHPPPSPAKAPRHIHIQPTRRRSPAQAAKTPPTDHPRPPRAMPAHRAPTCPTRPAARRPSSPHNPR